MALQSFRHPTTQILQAWGRVNFNAPGEIAQVEADSFDLEPGKWRWTGTQWESIPQSELDTNAVTQSRNLGKLKLNFPGSEYILIRALVMALLDEINILRTAASLTPRTPLQARNAILDKIDTGTVDT